jgi:hypothetical protein
VAPHKRTAQPPLHPVAGSRPPPRGTPSAHPTRYRPPVPSPPRPNLRPLPEFPYTASSGPDPACGRELSLHRRVNASPTVVPASFLDSPTDRSPPCAASALARAPQSARAVASSWWATERSPSQPPAGSLPDHSVWADQSGLVRFSRCRRGPHPPVRRRQWPGAGHHCLLTEAQWVCEPATVRRRVVESGGQTRVTFSTVLTVSTRLTLALSVPVPPVIWSVALAPRALQSSP